MNIKFGLTAISRRNIGLRTMTEVKATSNLISTYTGDHFEIPGAVRLDIVKEMLIKEPSSRWVRYNNLCSNSLGKCINPSILPTSIG